jgi:hypothetical protein
MTQSTKTKEKECCPKFDPKPFDRKTFVWKNKLFIQDDVMQLFHFPLNFAPVIMGMFGKLEKAKARPADKDFLLLAYDPSPWKSELYMTATKEVPGVKNVKLSGTFMTMVFDGPYNAVPNWIKEMDGYLAKKGKKARKYFFHYAYCPKCSKKWGHNYVVAFAQV